MIRILHIIFLATWLFLGPMLAKGQDDACAVFRQVMELVATNETDSLKGKQKKAEERTDKNGVAYVQETYVPLIRFPDEYENPLYKAELMLAGSGRRSTIDYYFDASPSMPDARKTLEQWEQQLKDCAGGEWASTRHYEYSFPYITFERNDDEELTFSVILMDNMDFRNPRYMINLQFNFIQP